MSIHQEKIRTFCRIKPLFDSEQKSFSKKNICTVTGKKNQEFAFDAVFDEYSTNLDVYLTAAKNNILDSFQGFNSSVLAYGQTSSGKTYTMKGTPDRPGIIPLCLNDIFAKIQKEGLASRVLISYLQIYNEVIYDLLGDKENTIVQARDDQKKILQFQNLKEISIKTIGEAIALFQKGEQRRKFASNNINVNSSRSHTIFRINLSVCGDDFNEISSQISLVDLAGSEGIDRTKGQKISKIQGENINKSILALNCVIKAMSQKNENVTFRNSKLTRILQRGLCENSKSSIICMINPMQINYQQCINTLKFGQMAGKIKIQARKNLIRSQQMKKKQSSDQLVEFLPSQRIQLEEARIKLIQYEEEISALMRDKTELMNDNYIKQQKIAIYQKHVDKLTYELQDEKKMTQMMKNQWWKQKAILQNRNRNYQDEIQNLQRINTQIKAENRILEKNQKSLVETLTHYENQCRNLNTQLTDIKAKINEQSSKTQKTSPMRAQINTKGKPQVNPFRIPPYRQSNNRPSTTQLASIVQLKIQIMDLSRQLDEYTKANCQIADQNLELKQRIEQYEENNSKARGSGKINPEALEYNEIKKLTNKIKNLKSELKKSQEREKKYRDILKKQNHKHLNQISQVQEFFNKKYDTNFHIDKKVQAFEQQTYLSTNQLQIQQPQYSQLDENKFTGNNFQGSNLILNNSSTFLRNQNPQEIGMRNSRNKISQTDFHRDPDENHNTNVNQRMIVEKNPFINQNSNKSLDSNESLLSDMSPHLGFKQSNNYIPFNEDQRSKRLMKLSTKQKPAQRVQKIKQEPDRQDRNCQNMASLRSMIPQDQKDIEI